MAVKKSPFKVKVITPVNPSKVQAFGPGLEKDVKPNVPTHFNVNCQEAGNADLGVAIKGPNGRELPIQLTDNENGTYSVDYVAPEPGNYVVNMTYGGLKVPQSPINVNVKPPVDISKIKVEGLSPSKYNFSYLLLLFFWSGRGYDF